MRSRFVSVGAAVALALVSVLTVLPGTALMASVTRPLFSNSDMSVSFTYDNVTMKAQSVHCDNFWTSPFQLQMVAAQPITVSGHTFQADEVMLTVTCNPGPTDFNIPAAQQPTITLNRGKPDGVYFRTA